MREDDLIDRQNSFLSDHVAKMGKINDLHIAMINDGFEPPEYGGTGIDAMVAVADYVKYLKEVDSDLSEY